ncbi:MAG: hypothetical protein ACE5L6_02065 [Candidatus Bathyarchaeia archaeon]
MADKVLLGYTVPEGKPFHINLHHTVVTGMTDLSGKTTTVEAILRRSEAKALVFLTKRGEKTFIDAETIKPFYKERFDWEYVQDLLEAARKEKLKFERAWIIRISKQSSSLEDFHQRLKELLKGSKKLRGIDRNVYTLLDAYLDKIMPVLEKAQEKFTEKLDLKPGLNVMDLTEWYTNEEVQMLIIRSCMEEILQHKNNVIVSLPEAWKMLPQFRNTPVKLYFEKFIREGATNGNFLIIDAQDLGGVDKTPLRQVSIWIMGKMMEANEVARILKQTLALDVKPGDIQTLKLGHFVVADGTTNTVQKVYVCPYDVPDDMALAVAVGRVSPETVKKWIETVRRSYDTEIPELETVNKQIEILQQRIHDFSKDIAQIYKRVTRLEDTLPHGAKIATSDIKATLEQTTKTVKIKEKVRSYTVSDETEEGRIMWLAKEGFFDDWKTAKNVRQALTERRWGDSSRITTYNALDGLVKKGFLGSSKNSSKTKMWKLAPNVKFEEE